MPSYDDLDDLLEDDLNNSILNAPPGAHQITDLLQQLDISPEEIKSLQNEFAQPKFEDAINTTKEKLSNRNEKNELNEEQILEQLMQDLQSNNEFDGLFSKSGDDDDLISSLLKVLATKEVLYEPLKAVDLKYPQFLKMHKNDKNYDNYVKQSSVIHDIVLKFEDEKYSDENEECVKFVEEKMALMQEAGKVPDELVGGGDCPVQ